jgi:hypothetical protein
MPATREGAAGSARHQGSDGSEVHSGNLAPGLRTDVAAASSSSAAIVPDLAIRVTSRLRACLPGGPIDCTVSCRNVGNLALEHIVISCPIPDDVTLVSGYEETKGVLETDPNGKRTLSWRITGELRPSEVLERRFRAIAGTRYVKGDPVGGAAPER